MATANVFAFPSSPIPSGGDYHPYEYLEHRLDLNAEQIDRRRREWTHQAFEEGEQWMRASEEANEVSRYVSYLMNKQWPTRRPTYKASPVNNILFRVMEKSVAVLTDIRPSYEVRATNENYRQIADVLTKVTRSWWMNREVDFALAMIVIHAFISTGYGRIVYNQRVGDFDVQPLGLDEIMPIGAPTYDLQEWEGVIYHSARPVSWFIRKFPNNGFKVRPSPAYSRYPKPSDRPGYVPQAAWDYMSPQMRRVVGGPEQYGTSVTPMAPYREFWVRDYSTNTSGNDVFMGEKGMNWSYFVKPGKPLYPRGRLIVTGGDDMQCMYDGPNFHWHGRWPFIPFRLQPVPWMFHGVSSLRAKIPMQDVINTILAGVLDMIKKALNPPLIYPDNAFNPNVIRNIDPSMPNLKLGYNANAGGKPPEYGSPPMMPSYVYQTMQYSHNEVDDDSGLLDSTGLAKKKVTPAGDTIEALREGQQTIFRLRGRFIATPIREMGRQMISNFLQFMPLRRRMFMLGKDGVTFEDVFDWDRNSMIPAGSNPFEYVDNFAFLVAEGSLLNVNQTEKKLEAFGLRRQQDMSRRGLYRALDREQEYEQIKRELAEEQEEAAVIAARSQVMGAMQLGPSGPAAAAGAQAGAPGAPPGTVTPHFGGKGSDDTGNLLNQG